MLEHFTNSADPIFLQFFVALLNTYKHLWSDFK